MRVLHLNVTGDDVTQWQNFLKISVSGTFDANTVLETIKFQAVNHLVTDGVVGAQTYAVAIQQGLPIISDDRPDVSGKNWPIKPSGINALSDVERSNTFGSFSYVAMPTKQDPEGIKITDNWSVKNIVVLTVPQLVSVTKTGHVQCHRLVANQMLKMFSDWSNAGLLDRLLSYDGCWVPRFKRGSTTSLSNHSWGTAIDLNASWNRLGSIPAPLHATGCTRELVQIALDNGFFWGAWFGMVNGVYGSRCDGMHFECFKVL